MLYIFDVTEELSDKHLNYVATLERPMLEKSVLSTKFCADFKSDVLCFQRNYHNVSLDGTIVIYHVNLVSPTFNLVMFVIYTPLILLCLIRWSI